MRYLRYLFLLVLAIGLITIAVTNRQIVTLTLLPEAFAAPLGFNWQVDLPLFLVVFAGIALGLLLGFVWEWLREARLRGEAGRIKRESAKMQRELKRLKQREAKAAGQDEVLALLEDGASAR